MKPVYFFLGANSEEGFFSLYDQLLGGRLDDLMILKGGPGCGKSTFMRRVGAISFARGSSISCDTTSLTRPHSFACSARINSPVKIIWLALPLPISRGRR